MSAVRAFRSGLVVLFLIVFLKFNTKPWLSQPSRRASSLSGLPEKSVENDIVLPPANNHPPWSCLPKLGTAIKPIGHTPFVVFAMPRTGSNFLRAMIESVPMASIVPHDMEVMSLGEVLSTEGVHHIFGLKAILTSQMENCQNATTRSVTSIHEHRTDDPEAFLQFLSNMPSTKSRMPLFAFKVFDEHLRDLNQTPQSLVKMVDGLQMPNKHQQPKYIVLWRRRIIESFVSHEIAKALNRWQNTDTSNIKVTVQKDELETYIQQERQYYQNVRDAIESTPNEWMVLEYDKDMRQAADQLKTIQKVATFLSVKTNANTVASAFKRMDFRKQANVALSEQIINWEQVVDWGYGGDVEEWEDLFPEPS